MFIVQGIVHSKVVPTLMPQNSHTWKHYNDGLLASFDASTSCLFHYWYTLIVFWSHEILVVRVAVEHAGLGQGLHKGVDEAPRDGGSPTIMPRREGITLSGRLLFMNGVAVSWPALVFEVDAEFRPMKLHNDRDSGQKVSLTGPESHSTKWYLMIECGSILGKKPGNLDDGHSNHIISWHVREESSTLKAW